MPIKANKCKKVPLISKWKNTEETLGTEMMKMTEIFFQYFEIEVKVYSMDANRNLRHQSRERNVFHCTVQDVDSFSVSLILKTFFCIMERGVLRKLVLQRRWFAHCNKNLCCNKIQVIHRVTLQNSGFYSVVSEPVAFPGNLLKNVNSRTSYKPKGLQTFKLASSHLCCNEHSR